MESSELRLRMPRTTSSVSKSSRCSHHTLRDCRTSSNCRSACTERSSRSRSAIPKGSAIGTPSWNSRSSNCAGSARSRSHALLCTVSERSSMFMPRCSPRAFITALERFAACSTSNSCPVRTVLEPVLYGLTRCNGRNCPTGDSFSEVSSPSLPRPSRSRRFWFRSGTDGRSWVFSSGRCESYLSNPEPP